MKFHVVCVVFGGEPEEMADWQVFTDSVDAKEYADDMEKNPYVFQVTRYEAYGDPIVIKKNLRNEIKYRNRG